MPLTDKQITILRGMVKKDLDASRGRLLRGLAGTGVEGEEVLAAFWLAVEQLHSDAWSNGRPKLSDP
jgi:hypothetical protein